MYLYTHAAPNHPIHWPKRIIHADLRGIPKSPIPRSTAGLKKPPEIFPTTTTPTATMAPMAIPK